MHSQSKSIFSIICNVRTVKHKHKHNIKYYVDYFGTCYTYIQTLKNPTLHETSPPRTCHPASQSTKKRDEKQKKTGNQMNDTLAVQQESHHITYPFIILVSLLTISRSTAPSPLPSTTTTSESFLLFSFKSTFWPGLLRRKPS